MENKNGSKGAWAIKNTVLPLSETTADENVAEINRIDNAARRLGATVDAYDLNDDGEITGVSVTGPADAIDALVRTFTADEPAPGEVTPLTIPVIDYFEASEVLNGLSGHRGNEPAVAAIEDWLDENAVAAATKYARAGRPDDAEAVMYLYDGDQASDPDDPCYDPESPWVGVRAAIEEARAEAATDDLVAAFRDDPANEDLDHELEANATDARNDPGNLFRAGAFEGLATAAAWAIYRQPNTPDDINAVKAAIYKAYGVAW